MILAQGLDILHLLHIEHHGIDIALAARILLRQALGEKVAEAAAKHGMTPQEWTDSQAPHFKELWSKLEISNDDFIRTTEPRQHHAVQYLWERMKESGYLYKGSYDGWYCVPDETYFTDTQVQKGDEEKSGCSS